MKIKNNSAREIDKRVTRAIYQYGLISPGDRILAAFSGGKDSLAMVWNLALKQKGFPINFKLKTVHLETFPGNEKKLEEQKSLLAGWNADFEIINFKSQKNCFACSKKRREILLLKAQEEGYNKIALGHHMDDSLITLLMNISWNSELAAMPPSVPQEKGKPQIIRPLILVQEKTIASFITSQGWPVDKCVCPFAGDSRRNEMAETLKKLTGGSSSRMYNVWKSLSNIKYSMLPDEK